MGGNQGQNQGYRSKPIKIPLTALQKIGDIQEVILRRYGIKIPKTRLIEYIVLTYGDYALKDISRELEDLIRLMALAGSSPAPLTGQRATGMGGSQATTPER